LDRDYLIASPLQQKNSTLDPSLKLADLATKLPADRIQVGITHEALAIPSKREPNDFPIALNAASRAKLDYLAVGHSISVRLHGAASSQKVTWHFHCLPTTKAGLCSERSEDKKFNSSGNASREVHRLF
jgi:hypothetical protein